MPPSSLVRLLLSKQRITPYIALCVKGVDAKNYTIRKAVTLLFGVRRSRLGPIQSQAVLKRPEWRASAKLAESPVMIIKSVFSL